MEFRRILVPHDFSSHATQALRTAVALAAPRARVLVLHVVAPYTPVTDVPPIGMAPYLDPQMMVADARAQLQRTIEKVVPVREGLKVECRVEIGSPADRIVEAAEGMDVVVMATTGRTGLSHLLIGSVAERVVRHANVPVLTLRPPAARRGARARRTGIRRRAARRS